MLWVPVVREQSAISNGRNEVEWMLSECGRDELCNVGKKKVVPATLTLIETWWTDVSDDSCFDVVVGEVDGGGGSMLRKGEIFGVAQRTWREKYDYYVWGLAQR
jgi:hypothetical protein